MDKEYASSGVDLMLLHSNWTTAMLLANLPEFRRIDDGVDLLAFRLAGAIDKRSVYVYLYGANPVLIHYDLEDEAIDNGEWDHAIQRGSVRSVSDLRDVARAWLSERCERAKHP